MNGELWRRWRGTTAWMTRSRSNAQLSAKTGCRRSEHLIDSFQQCYFDRARRIAKLAPRLLARQCFGAQGDPHTFDRGGRRTTRHVIGYPFHCESDCARGRARNLKRPKAMPRDRRDPLEQHCERKIFTPENIS